MDKPDCKYGADCYQKNPAHKEKYAHPPKQGAVEDGEQPTTSERPPAEGEDGGNNSGSTKRLFNEEQLDEDLKRCKRPPTPEKDDNNAEEAESGRQYHGLARQRHKLPEVPMDVGMMSDLYDPQIEYSKRAEYKELCEDPKEFIRHKFLVAMPACFDALWEFCVAEQPNGKPEDVFDKVGLRLVGPFDVLAGKFKDVKIHEPGDYLRHWRFYFDPPEFQTVLVKKGSGLHYGYWRDEPDNTDGLVACNDVDKGCEFKIIGQNVFDAIIHFLNENATVTPFNKGQIGNLKKRISEWTTAKGIPLQGGDKIKARDKLVVCKTFHKAGLVVPYDRKRDLGYRPLLESDANLRKMLTKFNNIDRAKEKAKFQDLMMELQALITAANIAVDECDFGTALELALDLFCHGTTNLHEVMKPLFFTGYSMLKRPQYIAIIKSHLDNRRQGLNLDLLSKE
ncbi:histone PARylation factor 1-like [Anopheles bellator]|uniref:histone PARylation factor 1-like n=1 Tax=Anopheles bellator TaxID=139047 RepID=UPI002648AE6E|nr:histone PARylation factor 1-like [Anopheles bellator]